MYLYSREVSLNSPMAYPAAKAISEHLSNARGNELAVYAPAYSPNWGRIGFTSWWEDLASLDAAILAASEDAKYMELSLGLAPYATGISDRLFNVTFTTSTDNSNIAMPNIVWSVDGISVTSKVVEAMGAGAEICTAWKAATGVNATFGTGVTGHFGAIGWLSGYDSMSDFEAAQAASLTSEGWIKAVTKSQDFFRQDIGAGISTIYRKM
jgi:hypothetical protein